MKSVSSQNGEIGASLPAPSEPDVISAPPKRRRGRPAILADARKRKRRNISVSDEAWDRLEKIAGEMNCSSKSDLLENIGQRLIKVIQPNHQPGNSSLEDLLIYRRLLGFLTPYHDVLWSLVTFQNSMYVKEAFKPDSPEKIEGIIFINLLKSITTIFQHSYIRPDRYVNSLSSLTRLISYCLIINKANLSDSWEAGKDDDKDFNLSENERKCLSKIGNAMGQLKSASYSPTLTALRLKYIGGFTESQILQIYELQGTQLTIEKIRHRIHEGWKLFRERQNKSSSLKPSAVDIPKEAKLYCHLLWSDSLKSAHSRKSLMRIILKAVYNAHLHFWLCEIEHQWSILNDKNNTFDKSIEQLKSDLLNVLDQNLFDRKTVIDNDMHYFKDRKETITKLNELLEDETGIIQNTKLGKFMFKLLESEAEESFALTTMNTLLTKKK